MRFKILHTGRKERDRLTLQWVIHLRTSKPFPNPSCSPPDSRNTPIPPRNNGIHRKSNSIPASPLPDRVNGNQNQNSKEDQAHYLFSKESPARSSTNSTPKRFFRRPFPPPSPAKHIKAVLALRHGSVKPNEAAIPEGSEAEAAGAAVATGTGLDKSFGFSKHFGSKYELGDEVGRGHFGYTCAAKFKKGELKGQEVAVKVIPKAKMTTAIAIEDVRREGVVHRDLKPENFLFTSKDEESQLKAIDFGLSDFLKPYEMLNDIVGIVYYEAPWPSLSSEARDFVKRLLNKDPRKRLTAAQALNIQTLEDLPALFISAEGCVEGVYMALSKTLTADELFYVKEQFAILEPNKNGYISLENIKALNALQYRRMDFDEFCAAALNVHQLEALDRWEQHARCAYELFEKDGNRPIFIEELALLRREAAEGKRMLEIKSGEKDTSGTGRKVESLRSMRDGRSYKDVVNSEYNLRREPVSGANLAGNKQNVPTVRNVWEMHIPSDNSEWVKRSLTGIMKSSFDHDSLKEDLEIKGMEVQVARWGYAWNACIITFNSVEDVSQVWMNKKEKLFLCFDWLASVLNKDGVPSALCQIELFGLPLLCWNEAFLRKLTEKWGQFLCFNEDSESRSDLSSAKVLLRVESPYDVPETMMIEEEEGRKKMEKFSNKGNSGYVLSEEGVGRRPTLAVDRDEFTEDARHKVIYWLKYGQNSGVNGVSGGHVQSSKSTADNSDCGLSGFLENRTSQNDNHVGLGLRDTIDPVDLFQFEDNEVALSSIKKWVPSGPAYNLKWVGDKFILQPNAISAIHLLVDDEGEDRVVKDNSQGEKEVVLSEQGVVMSKEKSVGTKSLDGDHVSSLQIDNDVERSKYLVDQSEGLKKMKKVMEDNLCNFNEESFSSSSVRNRRNENQEGSTSGPKRSMVRDSLEQVKELSQSSQSSVKARNEAAATRNVCELLGITFKGGQQLIDEEIYKMEMKGSSRRS
ncbi:CDPK-related protein kinase [Hibiscus syriacus]|uniref:non-specific serine/threonine protein kinase n=1 Tax=Hibiscus syriacus TaxID=106335 RepID=A0A6A3C2E2_HIBSY|nr:CDPK-related protein kinase [Hibiscus syriacus]